MDNIIVGNARDRFLPWINIRQLMVDKTIVDLTTKNTKKAMNEKTFMAFDLLCPAIAVCHEILKPITTVDILLNVSLLRCHKGQQAIRIQSF